MAVRIRFTGDVELFARLSPDEVREALEAALENSALLEIHGLNGTSWVINPSQVVYFEEVDDAVMASENDLLPQEPRRVARSR